MRPGERMVIAEDERDLAEKAADQFFRTARKCVDHQGRLAVALSGGTTPRPMYRRLSQEPYVSAISWKAVHVFWVDERMVPFDHPDSNFGAAKSDFLSRVPIPPHQWHPMRVDTRPEQAAVDYETELKRFFKEAGEGPLFDLVYLGVGKDGHTASLFPGQHALRESAAWVLGVKGGDPPVHRLTLTLPVLNRARQIVFMVSGREKSRVLKTLWEDGKESLPAGCIRQMEGESIWLVDRAAACLLSTEAKRNGSSHRL